MGDQEIITAIDQYVIDYVLKLRKGTKQTQEDIANILQVSRSFIKDVENKNNRAKYNLAHINALADYFNMKPGDFLPPSAIPVNTSKSEKPAPIRKNKPAPAKKTVRTPGKHTKNG